ncbi:MAG: hypothetical protein Q9210_007579, partial [Variospora velana]
MMEHLDDATLDAIVSSQLQDLDEFEAHHDGGVIDLRDTEAAVDIYRQELERAVVTLHDHRVSVRFSESCEDNMRDETLESASARGTRSLDIATRQEDTSLLVSTPVHLNQPDQDTVEESLDEFSHEQKTAKPSQANHSSDTDTSAGTSLYYSAETSRDGSPGEDFQPAGSCLACGESNSPELIQVPCDDYYCRDCLAHLFRYAMKDESLFPPQCCGQLIPMEEVTPYLNDDFAEGFSARALELSTLDRVYCSDGSCSAFIDPKDIDGDRATCGKCGTATCKVCKAAAHEGDCPEDPAVISLMAKAAAEGYKKCYSCR